MRGSPFLLCALVILLPTATASTVYDTTCFVVESDVLTPPSTDVPVVDTEADKVHHVYAEARDCDKDAADHVDTLEAFVDWLKGHPPDLV